MMRYSQALLFLALVFWSCQREADQSEFDRISQNLPEIGKFMFEKANPDSVANWLGRPAMDGRELLEPINLIIVDEASSSEAQSRQRLIQAFTEAGFGPRLGHSSGYFGRMNGDFYPQTPTQNETAFADFMWVFTNNHARMFGPFNNNGNWVWIGSSSREKGTIHDYVSFKESRDRMSGFLVERAGLEYLGDFPLENVVNSSSQQTGDHDGFAKLLKIK